MRAVPASLRGGRQAPLRKPPLLGSESGLPHWISVFLRLVALVGVLVDGRAGLAQDQWGTQDRADAASQMIVLAVQQAISTLPPTSGQAFAYTYDPETLTFVTSDQLGPTAFLSTYTVGKGQLTFRVAASYFSMSQSFGPITYFVESDDSLTTGYGKLGLNANAQVGLFNLSATYGLTRGVELSLNVPISIIDAHASETFSTRKATLDLPPSEAPWSGVGCGSTPRPQCRQGLDTLLRDGTLVFREETFNALGFDFNSGTSAGVGRIAIGGKGVLYTDERFRLAVAPQFFLPSPSEAEFAGPDSPAIFPRAVAQAKALERLFFTLDLGYDYDFDESALRRFAWNVGAWIPGKRFSFDFGIGGSEYDTAIRWTPSVARGSGPLGKYTITAQEDNQLGTTVVDFLGGVKVRLTEQLVASGAVTVPLVDNGFQPPALGTIALEFYF